MVSTIADIIRLFNIKTLAYAKPMANFVEGDFGIFDGSEISNTRTSIAQGTTWATLPDRIQMYSIVAGQKYFTADAIKKAYIVSKKRTQYRAEQAEIWKAVITNPCDCAKYVELTIYLSEEFLTRMYGISWKNREAFFVTNPAEIGCDCSCVGKSVLNNHLLTFELYKKINDYGSPYFYAAIENVATGAEIPTRAAINDFIETNREANTNPAVADSAMLRLVIKGKLQPGEPYKDLDINHIYPRGVSLAPFAITNGKYVTAFTKEQPLMFERGAGCDLRKQENNYMSLYGNLYHRRTLPDNTAAPGLVYQFENGKTYDVINIEFDSDKSKGAGNYNKARQALMLGVESTNTTGLTELTAMFAL